MSILLLLAILVFIVVFLHWLYMVSLTLDGVPSDWPLPIFGWNIFRVITLRGKVHKYVLEKVRKSPNRAMGRGWYVGKYIKKFVKIFNDQTVPFRNQHYNTYKTQVQNTYLCGAELP